MRIFLSRVTRHHGFLDDDFETLSRGLFHVSTQTRFAGRQDGKLTLTKLASEIERVEIVVQCLHEDMGSPVPASEVEEFLGARPDFFAWARAKGLVEETGAANWSYTQFEGLYAIFLAGQRAAQRLFFVNLSTCAVEDWYRAKLVELNRYPMPTPEPARSPREVAENLHLQILEFLLRGGVQLGSMLSDTHRERAFDLIAQVYADTNGRALVEKLVALLLIDSGWPTDEIERPGHYENPENYLQRVVDMLETLRGRQEGGPRLLVLLHLLAENAPTLRETLKAGLRDIADALQVSEDRVRQDVRLATRFGPRRLPPARIEVHCSPLSDRQIIVRTGVALGGKRVTVVDATRVDMDGACPAIRKAKVEAIKGVRRLLDPDRVEIMSDPALDLGEPYWAFVWEADAADQVRPGSVPTVLRWPFDASTSRELPESLERVPRDDVHVALGQTPTISGVEVFDEYATDRASTLRSALQSNYLVVWRRSDAQPARACLPQVPTRWRDIPRALHGEEWRHVGVGLNPDDDLQYKPTAVPSSQLQKIVASQL